MSSEHLDEQLYEDTFDACEIGERHANDGDHDKAADAYRRALEGAQRYRHPRLTATAGLGLGKALVELRRFDEAEPFLSAARRVFANLDPPIRSRLADCDQTMGRSMRQQGQIEGAITAYQQALLVYEDPALGLDDQRISCALNLANALVLAGRFDEALTTLEDAERVCTRRGDAIAAAINKGVFWTEFGQYESAHEQLERARGTATVAELHDLVAACDTNLGHLHRLVGRWDHAEAAFIRARDYYENRDQERFATSWMNMGTVLGTRGRHRDALDAYRKGLKVFDSLQLPERIAACQMNLGVEHAALEQLTEAREHFRRAQDFFESSPVHARQAAGCLVNIAGLESPRAARKKRYRDAAGRFHDLELFEWEARCAIHLAAEMPDRDAIEVLIPALLYLDSVKFQFPTAQARLAWRATVTNATRQAFERAMNMGNAELVAELVETTINSGIHTTVHRTPSGSDSGEDGNLLQLSRSEWTTTDRTGVGAVRLIAGACLPMSAPPRLRMPTGRVALERFYRAADRYRTVSDDRQHSSPSAVVDTVPSPT